ncbi:TetR/AcrR family transcriptional regulator [Saccharothrix algeriensis]|uniref:TetR family transcriptional regulator n=1 Tax=Catellatospora bangladeshensis TaxID=310355 RepID=A0A8J3JE52_9ACTN|nr:TetR family transcriptional regulator [Catellatospora bangladeshensis]
MVVTTPTGLRERKKEATRLALHHAALRLAAEHGLDHVTVEAIADAAEVSRRTFSNHFSSKEEAIAYGDTVRLRRLVQILNEQDPRTAPWDALTAAARQLTAETFADTDPGWLAQRRELRRHPSLAAQQIAAYTAIERELADQIAQRLTGPDLPLRARLLAATFMTSLRVAIQHWIDHPGRPLLALIDTALAAAAPAERGAR